MYPESGNNKVMILDQADVTRTKVKGEVGQIRICADMPETARHVSKQNIRHASTGTNRRASMRQTSSPSSRSAAGSCSCTGFMSETGLWRSLEAWFLHGYRAHNAAMHGLSFRGRGLWRNSQN